ncbi:MAG: hypothetical protein QOF51_3338, partial [Chloroflexota bacterium]|nr:hypothetical protein [Chloroflexota bacterium]
QLLVRELGLALRAQPGEVETGA